MNDYSFIDKDFYYECFDGWMPLLESLFYSIDNHLQYLERIRKPLDFRIVQVKEKFGGLRFYYNGGDDHVAGLVDMAEEMSYKICERCGNPGKPNKVGWIRTLCDKCMLRDTL